MKPTEKAKEMIERFALELKDHKGSYDFETARQCAIISVEELIHMNVMYHGREINNNLGKINYYNDVKNEIVNYQL